MSESFTPQPGDALILVDLQNDFLPGGALGVPEGDAVIPILNEWARRFAAAELPVFATRDWHPEGHCSFQAQGGPWPPHCLAGSEGAQFGPGLELPSGTRIISKAQTVEKDAYSGFQGTELDAELKALGVTRVWVGGLATDYCVRETVLDACKLGYQVILIRDAVRGVDVQAGDSGRALQAMAAAGARFYIREAA